MLTDPTVFLEASPPGFVRMEAVGGGKFTFRGSGPCQQDLLASLWGFSAFFTELLGWVGQSSRSFTPCKQWFVGTTVLFKASQPPLPGSAMMGREVMPFPREHCFCPSCTLGCSVRAVAPLLHHCHTHWNHGGCQTSPAATIPALPLCCLLSFQYTHLQGF